MKVNITIGAKTAFDTDIVNIQEKSGSITVHWKARPGGAHVYTDIQKQTLVDWYEQYAGGVVPPGPTPTPSAFEEMLDNFQSLLPNRVVEGSKTWEYLENAYDMADNEWENNTRGLFNSSNFVEIYNYRGNNNQYETDGTSYKAMQAWLMAMCLAELIPSSGDTTNNQSKLYQKAYTLVEGRYIPLYGNYTIKGDPSISRLVAAVIYAINRSGKSFSDMDAMRSEVGGSAIEIVPGGTWKYMGYEDTTHIGYNIASNDIFPSAPGPFLSTQSSRSHPTEQPDDLFYTGSETGAKNWWKDNYKIDVAVDNEVVDYYNLRTSDKNFSRTVQAAADNYEGTTHKFAEKSYYKCNKGSGSTTVDGQSVPYPRFTFTAGTSQTGGYDGYFEGTFNSEVTGIDVSDKLHDTSGNRTALTDYFSYIRDVGARGRKQLLDAQNGRRRPGQGTTDPSPRMQKPGDYRYNAMYDDTIEALGGGGTRYAADGTAHSWYIDNNGDGQWEEGEPYPGSGITVAASRTIYDPLYATTYTSGHSAGSISVALGLIQMLPAKAAKILKAAYSFTVSRTIVRAHWNSDIMYGRVCGTMMVPVFNAIKFAGSTQIDLRSLYDSAYDIMHGGEPPAPSDKVTFTLHNNCGKIVRLSGRAVIYVTTGDTTDWTDYVGVEVHMRPADEGTHWYYNTIEIPVGGSYSWNPSIDDTYLNGTYKLMSVEGIQHPVKLYTRTWRDSRTKTENSSGIYITDLPQNVTLRKGGTYDFYITSIFSGGTVTIAPNDTSGDYVVLELGKNENPKQQQ